NYNRVFRESSGAYFKWAAADDLCRPEFLARCAAVLENDPTVVLAYPKASFIDAKGFPIEESDPGWDLRSDSVVERLRYVISSCHWVNAHYGLIRRQALAATRLFPTYVGGDYRLLAELSLLGKFLEIPDYLLMRRIHPAASSQNRTDVAW